MIISNRRQEDSLYHNENESAVGRVILSSSITGGPRYYQGKFLDSSAIISYYHKPDLFITTICNPKWKEITVELKPGQYAQDRPDVVSRVFNAKKDQLMEDITKGSIFRVALAHFG